LVPGSGQNRGDESSVGLGELTTMDYLKKLKDYGPVLFGIGFIAPLIAQSMDAASLSAPLGVSNIILGLVVGISMGIIAKLRGRWV
jgi:hypothetical protein